MSTSRTDPPPLTGHPVGYITVLRSDIYAPSLILLNRVLGSLRRL